MFCLLSFPLFLLLIYSFIRDDPLVVSVDILGFFLRGGCQASGIVCSTYGGN